MGSIQATRLQYISHPKEFEGCSATVILLHGSGGSPENMLLFAEELHRHEALKHVQFIMPGPISAATGDRARVWFDMRTDNLPLKVPGPGVEDEAGIMHSISLLSALVEDLVRQGREPSRIVLGGYSQGGGMTLLTGLTMERKLSGLFVLSGRLPLRYKFKSMVSAHGKDIPVFWGHGTKDPVVTYELGQACVEYLHSEIGLSVTYVNSGRDRTGLPEIQKGLAFHTYRDMWHDIFPEELVNLRDWLTTVIPQ